MAIPTLLVTASGEPPAEFVVKPSVEIAFERDRNMALSDMKRSTDLYYLAYLAVKAVREVPVFEDWINTVDEVDWKDSGDAVVPLAPAPSPTA